jgi:hypothetical protein
MRINFFLYFLTFLFLCNCTTKEKTNHFLTGDLKHDAAVLIVDWIVSGTKLPNYDKRYDDYMIMKEVNKFFVTADFLPQNTVISPHDKVTFLDERQFKQTFEKFKYNSLGSELEDQVYVDTKIIYDYINLSLISYE